MLNPNLEPKMTSRTSQWAAAVTAASMAVSLFSGCFYGGAEDSPYTKPAGEDFQSVQLEVEPDGTPVLMATVTMLYAHNAPVNPWDSVPQVRNTQSLAYRRGTGGWNATSFRNLSQGWGGTFPLLLRVPGSGYQALVDDNGGVRRYAWRGGTWVRRPLTGIGGNTYYSPGGSGNFREPAYLAMTTDSTLLTINQRWVSEDSGYRSEAVEPGKPSVRLPNQLQLHLLHVGPGWRCAIGEESRYVKQGGDFGMVVRTGLVYLRWKEGSPTAERRLLDTSSSGFGFGGHITRFEGGYALLMRLQEGFRLYPLDSEGRPGDPEFIPSPEDIKTYGSHVLMDSTGCLHGLESDMDIDPGFDPRTDTTSSIPRFLHWNDCSSEAPDTLELPRASKGMQQGVMSTQFRFAPDGRPMAAFVLQEYKRADISRVTGDAATMLVFAEKTGGKWRYEVVERR